ncbi:MAG TPA: glycosyltransferase [Puia sp.]|nr:glycosyltransferase [Puia sp.]
MSLAPIALFTYNRPDHTRKTVEGLRQNPLSSQTDLFAFSDGPKSEAAKQQVQEVRDYLKTINGFRSVTIVERKANKGLSANIIDGVQRVVSEFGKVIVMEDDLIVSPYFLDYMNKGLCIYEQDENVISLHGYLYPVKEKLPETFFLRGADCLAWATWKRGWDLFERDANLLLQKLIESKQMKQFDFDGNYPFVQMLKDQIAGKRDSWAIRWYASAFLANKYTLFPGKSLAVNIGGDGSGTNNGFEPLTPSSLDPNPINISRIEVRQHVEAFRAFAAYYHKAIHPPLWHRVKRRLRMIFDKYQKSF